MNHSAYFERFLEKINLPSAKREKIVSAHNLLRSYLKEYSTIEKIYHDDYLQGSYKIKVMIKPLDGDEFDVDIIFEFDLIKDGEMMTPDQIMDKIIYALNQNEKYKGKIEKKHRCVRVIFSEGFHIDIVPAHYKVEDYEGESVVYIPDRMEDDWDDVAPDGWSRTNPKGYARWFEEKCSDSDGLLRDTVKLFKWWVKNKFGVSSKVKSIIISTAVAQHFNKSDGKIENAFLETLRNIKKWVDDAGDNIMLKNPAFEEENFTRDWSEESLRIFKSKISTAIDRAEKALKASSDENAVDYWREIFGDLFPSVEAMKSYLRAENLKEAAIKIASTSSFVSPSGQVNFEKGIPVKPTKFHGEDLQ